MFADSPIRRLAPSLLLVPPGLGGGPHRGAGGFAAGPELEGERTLLHEHREAIDGCQAARFGGGEERGAAVGEVVDERVAGEAFEEIGRHDPWRREAERLAAPGHWLSQLQAADLASYLPLDILTKVDRMSMAHSIETRVPLLDHVLVEFAARIPPELLLREGRSKHILKQAVGDLLPASVLDRPKRGFAIPLGRWFRGQLGALVRELLLSESSRRRGFFEPAYIEHLLRLHDGGRPLDLELWTLISFELWCRTFLDRHARGARRAVALGVPAFASLGAHRAAVSV